MTMEAKLSRRIKRLECLIELWVRRAAAIRKRRAFLSNPDGCLWIQEDFQVGWRHLVKRGADRGVLVVGMGWIVATVKW